MSKHRVILSHINTERTNNLLADNNEYVFEVDRKANKYVIKSTVQNVFNVKVDSVRTLIVPGKLKRMGRNEGKTSAWKKAIVRLKVGETIAMFDNV